MRFRTVSALAAVLAVGAMCASGRPAPPPDAPPGIAAPKIAAEYFADSVRIRLEWDAVLDARGAAVASYNWQILVDGVSRAAGDTAGLGVQRIFLRPQAGDSAAFVGTVLAVDVRGRAGPPGQTPPLWVFTDDPGPPAPIIRIDTLTVAVDSIRFERESYSLNVGDQVGLSCEVKVWIGDTWYRPDTCLEEPPGAAAPGVFQQRRSGIALLVYGPPSATGL